MIAKPLLLLGTVVLVLCHNATAESAADRPLREAALAKIKAQKANLEVVTKLGPEKFDEVLKLLGIQDPAALFLLQEYRKTRAEILELKTAKRPQDEARIHALEEVRDTYATGVFDQFDAIQRMLRNQIKAEERVLLRLDGVSTPAAQPVK